MTYQFMTLKIQRFHKEKDPPRWVQTFELEPRKGMNLLDRSSYGKKEITY